MIERIRIPIADHLIALVERSLARHAGANLRADLAHKVAADLLQDLAREGWTLQRAQDSYSSGWPASS